MIREPAVAGFFYPGDSNSLQHVVESFLQKPDRSYEAEAIVAPHAGYVYSGGVAGAVYSSVELPKRFVLLGPNHTGLGAPLSIYPDGVWRTPLGLASIDAELTELLERECPALREDRLAHAREHSIEVQIPFLQVRVAEFSFAAICVGTGNYSSLEELGHALARARRRTPEPVLIIVSSDMNHYESAEVSANKDRCAIDQVLALDPAGLYRVVREKDISMCGFAPAVAALIACRDLGATQGHLIRYANSGDVSGDFDRVVGYAGMVIN